MKFHELKCIHRVIIKLSTIISKLQRLLLLMLGSLFCFWQFVCNAISSVLFGCIIIEMYQWQCFIHIYFVKICKHFMHIQMRATCRHLNDSNLCQSQKCFFYFFQLHVGTSLGNTNWKYENSSTVHLMLLNCYIVHIYSVFPNKNAQLLCICIKYAHIQIGLTWAGNFE